MNIPPSELELLTQDILSHPEYLAPDHVINAYRKHKIEVIPDPFSRKLIEKIKHALSEKSPFSVIRIGDGETNLLSYDAYPKTPVLNNFAVNKLVSMQQDQFRINHTWMILLRESMISALLQADIIGVIGLWRPRTPTIQEILNVLCSDPRGYSGHWRGIDYMLQLASHGLFQNKTLASAHLYFGILKHTQEILTIPSKVFIISDRLSVFQKLANLHPSVGFTFIRVGQKGGSEIPDHPIFLSDMHKELPVDMGGTLSLIGAGPWAEIYCTWIKQRGGVAIDIGSGFDLLDGEKTRPIHNSIAPDLINAYSL